MLKIGWHVVLLLP